MRGRSDQPVRLRRSALAVLIGGWIGLGLLVLAVTLGISALIEGAASYSVAAVVCLVLWMPVWFSNVRIRDGVLVRRSILFSDKSYRISEVEIVEVGVSREGPGFGSYVGFVLVIVTGSMREILEPSRYCGRRRLESWARTIAEQSGFVGTIRSGGGDLRGPAIGPGGNSS